MRTEGDLNETSLARQRKKNGVVRQGKGGRGGEKEGEKRENGERGRERTEKRLLDLWMRMASVAKKNRECSRS